MAGGVASNRLSLNVKCFSKLTKQIRGNIWRLIPLVTALSTPDHQSPGLFTSVLLIPLTQVPVLVVWVSDGSLYINALKEPPFTLWCEIYESFVYKAPYSSQKRGKREKTARLDFFQIKNIAILQPELISQEPGLLGSFTGFLKILL